MKIIDINDDQICGEIQRNILDVPYGNERVNMMLECLEYKSHYSNESMGPLMIAFFTETIIIEDIICQDLKKWYIKQNEPRLVNVKIEFGNNSVNVPNKRKDDVLNAYSGISYVSTEVIKIFKQNEVYYIKGDALKRKLSLDETKHILFLIQDKIYYLN